VLLGLGAGLAVALWVYLGQPGLEKSDGDKPAETKPVKPEKPAAPPKPAEPEPTGEDPDRFQFYDLLPGAEVVVPEDKGPKGPGAPPPLERPGTYVLQAGAFDSFAEADATKARLALLGVKADIQKVTVDGRSFHRVRVGPIEDLDELNRLRTRLRQNKVDFLVIQVSE
jgi:cell division protein FtsN